MLERKHDVLLGMCEAVFLFQSFHYHPCQPIVFEWYSEMKEQINTLINANHNT